jgi:hypothetical protein
MQQVLCRVTLWAEILAQPFSGKNATLRTMVEGCRVTLLMEDCHGAFFMEECRAIFSRMIAAHFCGATWCAGWCELRSRWWLARCSSHRLAKQRWRPKTLGTEYQPLMLYAMLGEECCILKEKILTESQHAKNPTLNFSSCYQLLIPTSSNVVFFFINLMLFLTYHEYFLCIVKLTLFNYHTK